MIWRVQYAPMRRSEIFLLLLLLVGLGSCATRNPEGAPLVPQAAVPTPLRTVPQSFFAEEGLASWYGNTHDGKTTAAGERFDQSALTGAHRNLPFNTIVRVTDLKSGKTVKVRINDRGPFVKGRIIDLSAAAAAILGMAKNGINKVRVDAFAADQT
jgi:rare lipoprotein A